MQRPIPESDRDLPESKPLPLILRWARVAVLLAALWMVLQYKLASAPLGFCDTGTDANAALEEAAKGFVIADVREPLFPPLPLVPVLYPAMCTPCPKNANCTQDKVTCNSGYLLRAPFPLLPAIPYRASAVQFSLSLSPAEMIWKILSEAADGLPGFGPVALPPSCREDPKRKRHIGALGKAVEVMLAQERGRRLCAGIPPEVDVRDGGEARRWGIELGQLREAMKKKTAVRHRRVCFPCILGAHSSNAVPLTAQF